MERATPAVAAIHLFKSTVGLGVFFLPSAYCDAGWLLGPLVAAAVGTAVADISGMIVTAHHALNVSAAPPAGAPALTTPAPPVRADASDGEVAFIAVVRAALGDSWAAAVTWALVVVQFTWVLAYLQTTAHFAADLLGASHIGVSPYDAALCVATFAVLYPLTLASGFLQRLGFVSALATMSLALASVGTVAPVSAALLHNGTSPSASAMPILAAPWRIGAFIATNLSALGGIAVILPLHSAMAPAQQGPCFKRLVHRTLGGIAALYAVVGVIGYVAFGETVKGQSLIGRLPTAGVGAACRALLGFSLLLSCPIQFVPPVEVLDARLGIDLTSAVVSALGGRSKDTPPRSHARARWHLVCGAALRLSVCSFIAFLGASLGPDAVGTIIALLGATVVSFINVVTPPCVRLAMLRAQVDGDASEDGDVHVWAAPPGIPWARLLRWPRTGVERRCYGYVALGLFINVVETASLARRLAA